MPVYFLFLSRSTHAKSGWAKPLLPYIQPKQQITGCPSNPMHQGMCHCHHAPIIQSPCSHHHHSRCSASSATPKPQPSTLLLLVSHFEFAVFIPIRIKHAGRSNLSRSVFPSNTLSHPHPPSAPHPFPNFNLLMTTWHGRASFSPSASPKPPGLRLGLIWTLCHPVSIHHPHSPILSSPPSSSLPKRLWFKILYCELHAPIAVSFCLLPTATFPPAPQPQPILKQKLSPSDVG